MSHIKFKNVTLDNVNVDAVQITGQTYDENDTSNKLATCAFVNTTVQNNLLSGPQGINGAQGAQGINGAEGAQGAQGPQGVEGINGVQGLQGDTGPIGPRGAQGAQGNPGTNGSQGAQGNPGTNGSQGAQGDVGPTGPAAEGGSGITLDDTVFQIEMNGIRDLPVFAQNWMGNSNNTSLYTITQYGNDYYCNGSNAIACSGNGQYVFLGLEGVSSTFVPKISKDYGNTWRKVTPPFGQTFANAVACSISATGQYMIAINSDTNGDRVYFSTNFGEVWSRANASGTPSTNVAISSTGKYMLSAMRSYLAVSENYGNNDIGWSSGNSSQLDPSYNNGNAGWFRSVAMSHDGAIMYATTKYRLWKSVDYGQTWVLSNSTGTNYNHISCSSNGQYLLICPPQWLGPFSGTLYVSSNYGVTFTSVGTSHYYTQGAVSACGRYMTATANKHTSPSDNGYIYASNDYGLTWNQVFGTDANYNSIAMSHNGNMLYTQSIATYNNKFYVSNSNYTTCIQTVKPYGNVPAGAMYFNQTAGTLNIYNSSQTSWQTVTLTNLV